MRECASVGPSTRLRITIRSALNRAVDEWVALFDDPILANSALDRFAHRAHQIVMEGPSLRAARAPSSAKGSARPLKTAAQGG